MINNIFINEDGTIDPITFVAAGTCSLCNKRIAGGPNLLNYHIWKEHNEIHIQTVKKTYNEMSKEFKLKYTLEHANQMSEDYFNEIDKRQSELK